MVERVWSTGGIYTDGENPEYPEENLFIVLLCPPQIPLDLWCRKKPDEAQ